RVEGWSDYSGSVPRPQVRGWQPLRAFKVAGQPLRAYHPRRGKNGMHLRRICCAAAMGLLLVPAARAQGRWYVSGSLGAYLREDWSGVINISEGGVVTPGVTSTSYDPGLVRDLALGYRLPAGFRLELEAGYIEYQPSQVRVERSTFSNLNGETFHQVSGGDNQRYLGTINLFYDFPVSGHVVPYFGGGLGAAQANSVRTNYVDASGTRFT